MCPVNMDDTNRKKDIDQLSPPEQDNVNSKKAEQPPDSNGEDHEPEIDKLIEDLSSLSEPESEIPEFEEEFLEEEAEEIENNFNSCPNCGRELFAGECLHCVEDLEEIEDYDEEEEEEYEDDVYSRWREEMKKRGELNIIGIFCVVVSSIYIIYLSYPEVLLGLSGEFEFEHFLFHSVLLMIGLGALLGGLVMARHVIIYGRLFDTTFEKEIYSRLEPAFAEFGNIRGDLGELYDKMDRMNLHMRRMENRVLSSTNGGSTPRETGTSMRYTFLMILTLAVFLYIIRAPGLHAIYVLTALFLVWWVGVTSDFMLWKVNFSWTWAFFAVIVIPVASMLIEPVFGISIMIGIIGIALTLYALSYLTWAKYYVEGTMPQFFSSFKEEE
jgi:hypothetical protein